MKLILRDYQKIIANKIINNINNNNMSIQVSAASMGAGKSIIITYLVDYFQKKLQEEEFIVILVTMEELVKQLVDYFNDNHIEVNIIKDGYKKPTQSEVNSKKIWLIMEQSFSNKTKQEYQTFFDNNQCVITIKDEFHIGYGCDIDNDETNQNRYQSIISFLKPKYTIGFTGTPIDDKGYLLEGLTQSQIIYEGNVQELTEKKHLVPLKYFVPKWSEKINYSKVKIVGNDYSTKDLDTILTQEKYLELVLSSMNFLQAPTKKTLVYCNSIVHANLIFNMLIHNNYKVAIVHSQKSIEDNREAINEFEKENGKVDCLVSVSKLTTGFNQPIAQLLVLLRPTKILRLYLQIIYRVARKYKTKQFGEILDLAQCIKEHGFGEEQRYFYEKNRVYSNKLLQMEKEKHAKSNIIKEVKTNPTEITMDLMDSSKVKGCINESINNIKSKINLKKIDYNITPQNNNNINTKVKEVSMKHLDFSKKQQKDLTALFEIVVEIEIFVSIYFELKKRHQNIDINEEEKNNMINKMVEKYMEHKALKHNNIIKTFKNNLKYGLRNNYTITQILAMC